MANANLPRLNLPTPDIPTTVASAQEIERLVTLADIPPNEMLRSRAADPERFTWAPTECFAGYESNRNPILDAGWASYPWSVSQQPPGSDFA